MSFYNFDLNWKSHNARTDILTGVFSSHVWLALGWHDIRQRYRRSVLGPFWFTLSTLIMVGILGFLYSTLLKQDISDYLPFLGVGLVVWQFISTCVGESCSTLIVYGNTIKQIRMPISAHICRMVWRNFIILLHSLPVVVILMFCFGHSVGFAFLELIPGLFILLLQGVWSGIVFGLVCTRYRDVMPIVSNLIQVGFFLTPVMWSPEQLKERMWIVDFNPLYHLIEIVRAPILGQIVPVQSWAWSFGLLVVGFGFAQYLMVRCRERIPYWL